MSYRKYYWNKFKEQLYYTWYVLWNGVICNKGHHSSWGRSWFFKHERKKK